MINNPDEIEEKSKKHFQRYEGVKTLVFGATGFIGRWVARNLCAVGANVYLSVRDKFSAQTIFADYSINGEIFEMDLLNEKVVRELIQNLCPNIIFNLAGYGIHRTEQSDKIAFQINNNLIETICGAMSNMDDLSDWKGQNIINVGTAMEYGSARGNLAETSLPQPTTLYGKSKLAGTQTLMRCCQNYQLKGLTARLFAIYGPGESPERLLPSLIKAKNIRNPIELTAGLHKRDFVYVEDVAESLLRLGLTSSDRGEIVNVATGKLTSIRDFTKSAAEIIGISDDLLKFGVLPTRPEEMKHNPVTIERLKTLLEWIPKTEIPDGIRKTLDFEQTFVNKNVDYRN